MPGKTRSFFLPPHVFPLHRLTGLISDLFSYFYTKCPKQGRKGGLFVWDLAKKGPMTGARGPFCDFICPPGGDSVVFEPTKGVNCPRSGSTGRDLPWRHLRSPAAEGKNRGQLAHIGVNWPTPSGPSPADRFPPRPLHHPPPHQSPEATSHGSTGPEWGQLADEGLSSRGSTGRDDSDQVRPGQLAQAPLRDRTTQLTKAERGQLVQPPPGRSWRPEPPS